MLLIGTMKGAFLLHSTSARTKWTLRGPFFPGQAVYAMAYDGRNGRHRLWAATQSMHWGAVLCWSDDFGETWVVPETPTITFPKGSDRSLRQIWQIALGNSDEPDTLYCGVEPAALFKSTDAGNTWSLVKGLADHPHAKLWQPGGGGLGLHTILPDPNDAKRVTIAISTGGVYRTSDGGRTWQARNVGVRAEFLPDKFPEFGQCVHKIVHHPSQPERMYLQNHWGLYRSDDGGDSWHDIANGVPSDFGFPLGIHPRDPNTAYIVPLESDAFRCVPDGKMRVYRTRNGGKQWEALTRGLPQREAYETILRDGLSVDSLDPAGVYFGTRSGKVYGSKNEGTSWALLADTLPPVVCVKAVVPIPAAASRSDVRSGTKHKSGTSSRKAATKRSSTVRRSATRKVAARSGR